MTIKPPYFIVQNVLSRMDRTIVRVTCDDTDMHTRISFSRYFRSRTEQGRMENYTVELKFYSPVPGGERTLCTATFDRTIRKGEDRFLETQAEVDYDVAETELLGVAATMVATIVVLYLRDKKVPSSNIKRTVKLPNYRR